MAIAYVADRATATLASVGNSTPLTMASGASITKGNHLILYMAVDNSGTAGVDPNCEGITDPRGNTWIRLGKANRTAGVANDGAHVEAWFTRVALAYSNGDVITPSFSFPVARGCFLISEFSGIRPIGYPIVDTVTNNSSGTTIGQINITPSAAGQLVVALAAIETNTAITGDSDTTNGSWSAVGTLLSNSGTDATSMTLSVQRKIVTASGLQQWAVTKTGAADWAAMGFVLDTYTSVAPSFTPGNPNYPCIAGPENLSNGSIGLSVDTGTSYMFTHKIFPDDLGTQDYAFVLSAGITSSSETDPVSNHTIVGDVYVAGNETPVSDHINTATMFIDSATLGAGAETWNPETDSTGSGTALAALSAVGGECVRLQATEYVDVTFDPSLVTSLFPGYRILRWGIRYIAFKDDGEEPGPTNGMQVYVYDDAVSAGSGGNYLVGGWLTNNYRGVSQYETRWFGEVNGNPRALRENPLAVTDFPKRACWTIPDLSNMSTDMYIRIEAAVSDVFIDYIEAVIELAPERRAAHGARTISTAPFNSGIYPTGNLLSPVVLASDASQKWVVDDTDSDYVLCIREALPASPSDLYPTVVDLTGGDRTVAPMESIGPAVQMTAPVGPRETLSPDPSIRIGVLSRGVLVEEPVETTTLQGASVTAVDAINYPLEGSFFPAYYLSVLSAGIAGQVYAGNDLNQYIVVPGGQQYTRIKLLVAPDALTTDGIDISIEKPPATQIATASIAVADVEDLPDLGNGFVEISVPLSVAITPTSGRVYVVLSSAADQTSPWHVGGAIPPFLYAGYDVTSPTFNTEPYDYSVVLECPLASPTYVLGSVTRDIIVGSERCTSSALRFPSITLSNGASYDHIAIYRSEGESAVVLLDDPTNGQVFIDYEVPWDIPEDTITYTIVGYRDSDHLTASTTTTAWAGINQAPGAAFGLFSNELASGFAYIPTDERELDIEYSPLSPVSMVQRHGVDYQVALMAPEERGLAVTVTVIAARVGLCDNGSETPDRSRLDPEPFTALRSIERNRRMMLNLPGGSQRWVYVKNGKFNVRTQRGTFMAEITLTDTEPKTVTPYV